MRELARVVLLPGDAGVVVEDLESAEVPAPALVAVTHQALVTHRVQRRLACPHPQHRVGAALPGGPGHLETRNIVEKLVSLIININDIEIDIVEKRVSLILRLSIISAVKR